MAEGRRFGWPEGGRPFIDERGVLRDAVEEAERDSYSPFFQPHLPNQLARARDERRALDFVRRYGPLGFAELAIAEVVRRGADDDERERLIASLEEMGWGDPLNWLLAQARSVRMALEIIEALVNEPARVELVLDRHRLRHEDLLPFGDDGPATRGATFPVARGAQVGESTYEGQGAALGRAIVVDLVAANTVGVGSRLVIGDEAQPFRREFRADALIEVAWWWVGEWAAGGHEIRRCELEDCRLPFVATHGRQRFCPGDVVYDEHEHVLRGGRSRCASLDQKRRQRQEGE
jgi:hypothetical protein